jgi:hypothetical protein
MPYFDDKLNKLKVIFVDLGRSQTLYMAFQSPCRTTLYFFEIHQCFQDRYLILFFAFPPKRRVDLEPRQLGQNFFLPYLDYKDGVIFVELGVRLRDDDLSLNR